MSGQSAQLRAFLEVAKTHRLFAFYHLAAYTGARRGELLNLRWRDVDQPMQRSVSDGSAAVVGGTRIEGTTKRAAGRGRSALTQARPKCCRTIAPARQKNA